MNKQEYLDQLKTALKALPKSELEEIVSDYDSYFDEAFENRRSYGETAKALGEPADLANEHLLEFYERTKSKTLSPAIWVKYLLLRAQMKGKQSISAKKELNWTPDTKMSIEVPIDVYWYQSEKIQATLEGPKNILEHVRLDIGKLHGHFKWQFFKRNQIKLELRSPAIEQWSLTSSSDLYLNGVKQNNLHLHLKGCGEIQATGQVENVFVDMEGTGDLDISKLDQKCTTLTMVGMGDAFIAPTQEAILSMTGRGDIKLLHKPEKIKIQKDGKGDIKYADGTRVVEKE